MFKRNLAGIVVMAGFIGLTQLPKAVQSVDAQSHEAAPGPAPTTPWGDPDLEGIWTRDSEEPLQRPTNFTDKEFFTDEERADLDRRRAEIIARDASRERRATNGRGTAEQDVGGAYNAEIYTSHLRLGRRTSMIVDPPNGRLPDLAPRAKQEMAALIGFSLALKQSTEVCENALPACQGGEYTPTPSPRRYETPPHYITARNGLPGGGGGVISRSDGPEDRGHGERATERPRRALPTYTRSERRRTAVVPTTTRRRSAAAFPRAYGSAVARGRKVTPFASGTELRAESHVNS